MTSRSSCARESGGGQSLRDTALVAMKIRVFVFIFINHHRDCKRKSLDRIGVNLQYNYLQ